MRTKLLFVAVATIVLQALAGTAQAALAKYAIRTTFLIQFEATSPRIDILNDNAEDAHGTVVIDDDGGSGFPVLQKYVDITGGAPSGMTVDLPGLSGFIYFKRRVAEGPANPQTGTGFIATDIAWGFVDSWTISGGVFCNAVPSTICVFAMGADDETVPPQINSAKFDFHEWHFHPTGYRADPYISLTGIPDLGNALKVSRGVRAPDGTAPALPLVGIGVVGASVVGMGVSALRRKH